MKERRYKKEFRTVTRVDPRTGRERSELEYTGVYYRFPASSPTARERAVRLAPWIALFWLAALLYLKTANATGRFMAALVPMLAALIPGFYALLGLFALLCAPARLTVVDRENGPGRLTRAALGCGIFAGIAAVGALVCLTTGGTWRVAWHEFGLIVLADAAMWRAFAVARRDYRDLKKL